ncbi:HipA domain-containing protein [Pseudomonas sp. MBLB4123]|uniref:HipA domain-containing protein n=1 Tax=Pseudomonas sp. MBLB4123 TaxID=3451557 RepID=UPI003F74BA4A
MDRQLNAWINHTLIGTVTEHNGLWSFVYTEQWLRQPGAYPLCPGLPLQADPHSDGASMRPVQWYFDNLLPEEGQRQLIARAARTSVADAFGLLTHFGAESAGSVTLLRPGQQPAPGELRPLPDETLSRRIREMPRVPLAEQAAKRMSLAGAQHKMAIIFDGEQLFEPTGNMPSTHILKPDHPDMSYAHSVINEWFVMTLAKRMGLQVPEVTRRYMPQPVYLISRFDRRLTAKGWERLHCIDACQLLGLDRAYKYDQGSVQRLLDISKMCSIPAKARLELFRWLVFNVLVGNGDAHLKNLSFLMTAKGATLSPFYDLLSTAVYTTRAFDQTGWPEQVRMAWPIGEEERITRLNRTNLVAAGEAMGLKARVAQASIDKMTSGIQIAAAQLLEQVILDNQKLSQEKPALQATLAGETRCLRAIVSIVIGEMSKQLA